MWDKHTKFLVKKRKVGKGQATSYAVDPIFKPDCTFCRQPVQPVEKNPTSLKKSKKMIIMQKTNDKMQARMWRGSGERERDGVLIGWKNQSLRTTPFTFLSKSSHRLISKPTHTPISCIRRSLLCISEDLDHSLRKRRNPHHGSKCGDGCWIAQEERARSDSPWFW